MFSTKKLQGIGWSLFGVQEVPGSNPGGPTKNLKELQTVDLHRVLYWSPTGVQNGRRGVGPLVESELAGPDSRRVSPPIDTDIPDNGHLSS